MINLPKRLSTVSQVTSHQINLDGVIKDPIYESYLALSQLESLASEVTNTHIQSSYMGIREGSDDIVKEGLGDFIEGTVRFFKRLIEKLMEFVKQASLYMTSLFGSFDKFLDRNKEKLLADFKEFSIYGHEYTIKDEVPKTSPMVDLVSEFNKDVSSFDNVTKSNIVEQRRAFFEEGAVDKLRGAIIDKGPIRSEDFRETLKTMFRNGADEEKEIRVDKAKLGEYIKGYRDLKKTFDDTRKSRVKLEQAYRLMESFFARGAKTEYVGNVKKTRLQGVEDLNIQDGKLNRGEFNDYQMTTGKVEIANLFYQFKWKQAQEISSYSFQAYTERVDAIREAVKFYEKVIRKSIFSKGEEVSPS